MLGTSQSTDLLPINNFKAKENKSYGSALSPGQTLSSNWKQIGHMSPFHCSRRVWCRGILRCRWCFFFSLVSQTGWGKHNSVSGYDSKRHLSILAVPAHLAFQWHLKFIITSLILVDKQTKVANDSLFNFCRCQKVRQMIPIICLKPNPYSCKKWDVSNCFLDGLLKILPIYDW